MTKSSRSQLEEAITEALHERADALPVNQAALATPSVLPSRHRGRWYVIGAAAAAVIVAVATIGALASRGTPSHQARVATSGGRVLGATPTPVGATGVQVSIAVSNDAAAKTVLKSTSEGEPVVAGTVPIAVATPNAAPVVVSKEVPANKSAGSEPVGCATIIAAPTSAGYQGTCTQPGQAATTLVVANDRGPLMDASSTWYFVWTDVPSNAAYVEFVRGNNPMWQAPVQGVSYFTLTGAASTLAADPPVERAFDASGNQIGEARVPQWQLDLAK